MSAKITGTEFEFIGANLPFWPDPAVAIASARAGATGLLNLEGIDDLDLVRQALQRLVSFNLTGLAVKLNPRYSISVQVSEELPEAVNTVVLAISLPEQGEAILERLRKDGRRVLVEVTEETEELWRSANCVPDGFVAKGHEAPGRVGEETTFILLQRLRAVTEIPVFAYGGIGLHSVAACYAAGAAGVILDSQFALAGESNLPVTVREAITYMEGDETVCLGNEIGGRFRVLNRPSNSALRDLEELEQKLIGEQGDLIPEQWFLECEARVDWKGTDESLWPLGQDAAFAASLGRRYQSVSGIIRAFRRSLHEHIQAAVAKPLLQRGSSLAQAHGTEYPIVQGPMTRVSDVPEFADAVARSGALPFLALALLRADRVRSLLKKTQQLLGERPWGVGILGFVPPELRQEQLGVIREIRPRFAIIAGGRPDQAARLEDLGIRTYLHVPSPILLRSFLEGGARRFIFEGRECGGHVGPRSSFVLWNTAIDVLSDAIDSGAAKAEELNVLFAGGIHDARSAAMVSAMAAPLARSGVNVGILMGTAYLFTREAVESGAIVEGFQETALSCSRTVLLETGPGHATRCAVSPFYEVFRNEKQKLLAEQKDRKEVQSELEDLNLGRLRIASKGIARGPDSGEAPSYVRLDHEQQFKQGMYMIGQLASLRHGVSSMAELHSEISAGSARVLETLKLPFAEPIQVEEIKPNPCDVAIVGMGCLLAGAQDRATFWRNIIEKVDAIREIPSNRFDSDRYFDDDARARDKIYSKWGGFLDDIPFDPFRYGIPPSALTSIDPLQLLSLEVVRQALEDAGYSDGRFNRENTSVILGAGGGLGDLGMQYGFRSNLPMFLGNVPEELLQQLPEWTEDSFAGILLNVAAGRVANRFDMGGLNFTVDAACASSLAAIYLAARELQDGHSDLAIAGGVDTVQSPFGYLCFSKTRALSAQGRCRTFDDGADGIAISEGLAVLVLKRLRDAEKDGDRIYAVLKSVAGSSDGRDRSLTAPRPEGQMRALRRAYARAGISPSTVGLVEAHGTGTVAGDAAEVTALTELFTRAGASPQNTALGSVKSMIGHTKCAAGAAGLMKVALALYYRVLPPTLHVSRPNSKLRTQSSPFFVNTEPLPWFPLKKGVPRRAGVSSFGFGGTNFHAVVEEYQGDLRDDRYRHLFRDWPEELFTWQSSSESALVATLSSLKSELEKSPDLPLRDLAATVWGLADRNRGNQNRARLAIVASSVADLKEKIEVVLAFLSSRHDKMLPKGVYLKTGEQKPEKLAFLFSGQGAQYPFMLRDLAIHLPDLREALEYADEVLSGRLDRKLSSYVYPPPPFSEEEKKRQAEELTDTLIAQPALGAVEMGLLSLFQRFGLKPDMVAGHSYGEYVALYAAGVISKDDLLLLSEQRGRSMKEAAQKTPGKMLAVSAPAERIEKLLQGIPDVWLANYNAPRQTIIAGSSDALENAGKRLQAEGIRTQPIAVSCPFHTPLLEPARERFAKILAEVSFSKPTCELFSNSTGKPYPSDPGSIREQLKQHLVRPVQFADEIEAMFDSGGRVFLEIGPRNILTGLASQILENRDALILSSDLPSRPGLSHLLHVLGQLLAEGVSPRLDPLFEERANRCRSINELIRRAESERPRETGWYVNGGKVWSRSSPPKPVRPVSLQARDENFQPQPTRHVPVHDTDGQRNSGEVKALEGKESLTMDHSRKQLVSDVNSLSHSGPGEKSISDGGARGDIERVMLGYQKLMSQFLETQKNLMAAYLRGEAEFPAVGEAVEQAVGSASGINGFQESQCPQPELEADDSEDTRENRQTRTEYIFETRIPSQPQPDSSGPQPQTVPSTADRLLELVAERTGYPVEMLDLKLGIEADLGIDSIKRVEILNSFQQRCKAEEQAKLQESMERLTGARTLGEMVAELEEALGSRQSAPPTAQPDQPTEESHRVGDNLKSSLLELVAERTGYPVEMLDLKLGIEADLGIDSIKRVEILNSFQQRCSAEEQAKLQESMERLTGARTLGEMVAELEEALGSRQSAPPTAQPGQPAEESHRVSDNLKSSLLELVAERTGYPVEMLDLKLGIEADLGIDSIKRVEILNSFQQRCSAEEQAQLQESMERLTGARTLGEMVTELESVLAPPQHSTASSNVSEPFRRTENGRGNGREEGSFVPRFYLIPAEAPARITKERDLAGQVIVITDDEKGIALDLASRLRSYGAKPFVLTHTCESSANPLSLDLTDSKAVEKALNLIRQQHGPIEHLIHLLPLRSDRSFSELDLASWRKLLQRDLKSIYNLARLAQGDLQASTNRSTFLTVTAGKGGPLAQTSPVSGGVSAFTNTLAAEWPEVFCRSVEVELDDVDTSRTFQQIWTELHLDDELVLVVYSGGRRATLVAEPAPLEKPPLESEALKPDSNWVFLLTGGARGITATIARQLASSCQPTLILVGLSPAPAEEEASDTAGTIEPFELKKALRNKLGPKATVAEVERSYWALLREREIRHNIRELRRLGARVEYHQVDVRDEDSFGALIKSIYERYGRLDGVIHGAGLIEDKLLKDKTPESFDRVLHTKADSAFILIRHLQPETLKLLVLMSSVTAVFGNRGQSDYAAANGILNSLAVTLSKDWPARVLAANWGPWDQTGMVTDEVRAQFLRRGVQLIPPDQGSELIQREMFGAKNGHAVVVYGDGPWASAKTLVNVLAEGNYVSVD